MTLLEMIDRFKDSDRLAFISSQGSITYRELYRRSVCLAYALEGCFSPLVVRGHKEPEMLVAFLACLRLNVPFVPVDTNIPEIRLNTIVEMAKSTTVLDPFTIDYVSDTTMFDTIHEIDQTTNDCMYIMFTSGSSGEPKGVKISYDNVLNFVEWMQSMHQFDQEVILNQAPFHFDLSVIELWCGLSSGSTIVGLTSDQLMHPKNLIETFRTSEATVWVSTPSFADFCLASAQFDEIALPKLRKMIFCGETLEPRTAMSLLHRFGQVHLFNMYGPTETTCAVTSIEVDWDLIKLNPILPVGYVQPGTTIHVTNNELVIGGRSVGLGYIGIDKGGFVHTTSTPYYFTGDLGRVESNGLVFMLGRTGRDRQVKVGGRRIDLDDIRSNLLSNPLVHDCRVWVFGGRSLRAEVVVSPAFRDLVTIDSIVNVLRHRLPEYMIPRIDLVTFLPLTSNGKKEVTPMNA